jgi:hypothetical protein
MCRSYRDDEGRPFETGLQKQVSNHLVRLWSKALVVSNKEKVVKKTAGEDKRGE